MEVIHPNWHIILIHYPLGLLVVGVLIELFSFLWRRSTFRLAGRWMILLGVLSMVPTTFSGLFALNDVVRMDNPAGEYATWAEAVAQSPVAQDEQKWHFVQRHAWMQGIATVVALLTVMLWIGASDRMRRKLQSPALIVLIGVVALMAVGAWYSGEAVYRHGVAVGSGDTAEPPPLDGRVGVEPTPSVVVAPTTLPSDDGVVASTVPSTPTTVPTTLPATGAASVARDMITSVSTVSSSPAEAQFLHDVVLQAHVIGAGFVAAIAVAGIGLSMRRRAEFKMMEAARFRDDPVPTEPRSPHDAYVDAMLKSLNPETEVVRHDIPPQPVGRFWLLAAALALLVLAGGAFFLITESDTTDPALLWNMLIDSDAGPRRLFHVIAGGAILVLTLVLAAMARWAPRSGVALLLLGLLLILSLAAQTWLGSLLLFDTTQGPVTGFNLP